MEALLALGIGQDAGAQNGNNSCNSTEELQLQLTNVLESKASPTRAEHVSVTYEFRSPVVFTIPASESESDGIVAQAVDTSQALRQINANDVIVNQPQDDPMLQTLVAKHIMAAIGRVDGSSWIVRQVSRLSSGWSFTYICRDSMQAWLLQSAKNPARSVVGESSGKDGQDPINLARPAFDCRGSVTVSFVRSSRLISVKYEHTPLHRTVQQLADFFAPPAPTPAPTKRQLEGAQDGEGSKKKRKKSQANGDAVQDGETPAKKKRKKKDSNVPAAPMAPMMPPDLPGTLVGATTSSELAPSTTPKPKKPRALKKGTPRKSASSYPEALVSDSAGQSAAEQAQPGQAALPQALLNLPPGEETRRRQVATKLLSDAGLDPQSLSIEQFNIFMNQSPDLQKESLAMLVKYGAERLRIVHPNKDTATASASPTPTTPPQPISQTGETAAETLPTSNKKEPWKKKTDGEGLAVVNGGGAPAQRKPKQTRGSCESCKARKVKCPKEKPHCSECTSNGLTCFYGPPRVRNSKAVQDAEEVATEEEQVEDVEQVEEASDLGSPGFVSSNVPNSDLQTSVNSTVYHQPADDYFQSHPAGLTFPQPVMTETPQQPDYTHFPSQHDQEGSASHTIAHTQEPHVSDIPAPVPQSNSPTTSRRSSRRHLPSGPSNQTQAGQAAAPAVSTSSWNHQATAPQPSTSAQVTGKQSGQRQSRSRKSANTSSYEPHPTYSPQQSHDGLQQAAALSQAATQEVVQPPKPAGQTSSPFQTQAQPSRTRSRQSQRSQSRTATASIALAHSDQPQSQPTAASTAYSASTASDPTYDGYSRYNTASTNDQSSSRGNFESYSNQSTTSSYPTYEGYNTRSHATSSSSLANPATQSMQASYNNTTAPNTSQWTSTNSGSRNNRSYTPNNASSTSASTSYNVPQSSTQQSQSLQSFNVRPGSTGPQTRSSSNTYTQHQQQDSYTSYPTQPQGSSTQQQQPWYGFTPANNSSSNYGSSSRGTEAGGYSHAGTGSSGSYQQQHKSMNLSGHTYSSIDGGDQGLYDMFRGGSGH